jgi:hypothetical protein
MFIIAGLCEGAPVHEANLIIEVARCTNHNLSDD